MLVPLNLCMCFSTVPVSSPPGPNDCVDNISMSENSRVVPPGIIVCLKCSVGDEVAADATFQIDNSNIDESTGRVVDGVLVLFDTESVFTTAKRVQCMSVSLNVSHSILISLNGTSYYTESPIYDLIHRHVHVRTPPMSLHACTCTYLI